MRRRFAVVHLVPNGADDDACFTSCRSAVEHVRRGFEIGAVLACLPWGGVGGGALGLDDGSGLPDDQLLFRASDVVCREQRTSRR